MNEILIEVVNIDFPDTSSLDKAMFFLNKNQKTFKFTLLEEKRFISYRPLNGNYYTTKEIYDLMDQVLANLRGFHNLVIGVVQRRLDGKEWGNLFGSIQENENKRFTGKAIISSYKVDDILGVIPIDIYYVFELLSIATRFTVGKGMIHDDERGCLFHRKIDKNDILDVIREGYICLKSQRQINQKLELDQVISFRTLLSIISEIARSDSPRKALDEYIIGGIETVKRSLRSKVFISYSHSDKEWLERLKIHLKPFERNGIVNLWDDTKIKPGKLWRDEIKQALDSAKIAILLVSPNFLASDFIMDNELPKLLLAAEKQGSIILPVILRPCSFSDSDLEPFQAVNNPAKPLSGMTEHDQDLVFVEITKCIREAMGNQ